MRLENSFEVAAPVDRAWRLLNDVPAVVPCMPGAELIGVLGEDAWKAKLHVKLGPMALQFLADVNREHVDEQTGRVVLAVKAREAKGRGGADATIESAVSDVTGRTRVDVVTELALRGVVAQYGRGVVGDVASRLTEQFATCIAQKLGVDARSEGETSGGQEREADMATGGEAKPKPIGGLGLFLGAVWRSLVRRRPHR